MSDDIHEPRFTVCLVRFPESYERVFDDLDDMIMFIRSDECRDMKLTRVSRDSERGCYFINLEEYFKRGMLLSPGYQAICADYGNGIEMYFGRKGFARRPKVLDDPECVRDIEYVRGAVERLRRIEGQVTSYIARFRLNDAILNIELYLKSISS